MNALSLPRRPAKLPDPPEGTAPVAAFHAIGDFAVGGWVVDPAAPGRRLAVEIRADGVHLGLVMAESFSAEAREHVGGDGCHGFTMVLDPDRLEGVRAIEAVLANTEVLLGVVPWTQRREAPDAPRAVVGELLWAGGLRASGFAHDFTAPGRPVTVEIHVDGDLVARVPAERWHDMGFDAAVPSGRIGYDVALPLAVADGTIHTLRATVDGVDLDGSPTRILAHATGFGDLAAAIDPGDTRGLVARARMLDRLMPGALPLAEARAWLDRFPVDEPPPARATLAVLVLGGDDAGAGATLASLEAQGHAAWIAFHVPDADPGALEEACREVRDAGVDAIVVVTAGTVLDRRALAHLAAALETADAPGLVHPDVVLAQGGRHLPLAFPGYDRFRMRAQGYAADLFALAGDVFESAVATPPRTVYDLLIGGLSACEAIDAPVAHLPQFLAEVPQRDPAARADDLAAAVLADARRRNPGEAFVVEAAAGAIFPAVHCRRETTERPAVSVVIPTRDRLDLLEPCISSLLARTEGVDLEIIVVDNGSREAATLAYLDALRGEGHVVVRADIPFNYSRLNNLAIARTRHDLVCLLNNDIEVIEGGWLAEMARLLDDAQVGVVGATLLWPSRIVQHGGVVVGPQLAARHAFTTCLDGEAGYADTLLVERRNSAVTAACLLLRRADYEAVGGLDEATFPVTFNDVDLCLKVGRMGKAVVMTPRARLLHKESASRGLDVTREKHARSRKEMAALRERWAEILVDDPFYNPNLGLDLFPFDGLATPPRARRLRVRGARD